MLPLVVLLYGVACLAWISYQRQRRNKIYFANLPGPPATSFWAGNLQELFSRQGYTIHSEWTQKYGPAFVFHGLFGRRMLYVSDPDALTTILLREPADFEEGSSYVNANILVFGPGISSLSGEPHRKHKRILAPAFSATEIRETLPTVRAVAAKLHTAITSRVANGPQEIDIMHWLSRATLEIIGQAGLGHSFDSLIGEERDDFGKVVNTIFPIMGELSIFRPFLPAVFSFGTPTLRRCLVDVVPFGPIKRLRRLADTMDAMSTKIYRMKQHELRTNPKSLQQVKESKDIISSLLRANLDASSPRGLNEREVAADISLMITAATDTTATTISRILQLLSQHPDYQERLRTELRGTVGLDELPFEELNKLPLLDAVLKETLRLYPPGGLTREVQKDTVLPLYQPVYCPDGTVLSEIPLPAGTEVMVGILGCNTSKAIWGEDALEWKPERWLSPLPSSITDASIPGVYSNIMTFVGGKRSCIGLKFAELSIKALLSMLIAQFSFKLTTRPITWNMATVLYPTMTEDGPHPEMILEIGMPCKDTI